MSRTATVSLAGPYGFLAHVPGFPDVQEHFVWKVELETFEDFPALGQAVAGAILKAGVPYNSTKTDEKELTITCRLTSKIDLDDEILQLVGAVCVEFSAATAT